MDATFYVFPLSFRWATNLVCTPLQLSSHFPLTVPVKILFALISTSSTKLHSPSSSSPTTRAPSSLARVSRLTTLHVVLCNKPSGARIIHSMPSSVFVISASKVTVVSHSPLGRVCILSVTL